MKGNSRRNGSGRFLPIIGALALLTLGDLLPAGQEPFPTGTEGVVYYCFRIDLNPVENGGPLTIALDGSLDEDAWMLAEWQRWSNSVGNPLDLDPPELDCDLTWAAVADDQYLYIAWKVVDDDRSVGVSTGCEVWQDDSIEVYIDALNDGPECPGAANCYGTNDSQITIGADQIGKATPEELVLGGLMGGATCIATGPAPEVCLGMVADLVSEEGYQGWQGEAAIALSTAGVGGGGLPTWDIVPSHGTVIGWNFQANDDDAAGDRDHKLTWSLKETTETSWQNPGAFGDMMFLVPGKPLFEIRRDIPDGLVNGTSGTATITVTPKIGTGTVEIQEELPAGLIPKNPSSGGTLAGNVITWKLADVQTELVLTYDIEATEDAIDAPFVATATIDGEPIGILGDSYYTGSPFNPKGFIKLWNHLGPFGGGNCGVTDLLLDWIVNEDGSVTEANILPYPGLVTRPKYGGDGIPPPPAGAGTGAKAANLMLIDGKTTQTQPAIWKGGTSASDTVDHKSAAVNGWLAFSQVTLSCVYVKNKTGGPVATQIGFGSDDSIQVLLNGAEVAQALECRGWGNPEEEQNVVPLDLPDGESILLVKVANGAAGDSGFRLRFQDPDDPTKGLLPPRIAVILESEDQPRPGSVVRSLAKETFIPGEAIDVTLEVAARSAADMDVDENLPPGCRAEGISDGGSLAGGAVQWSLVGVTQKTLTYKLIPGSCDTEMSYPVSSFTVGLLETAIEGPTKLALGKVADSQFANWTNRNIGATGGAARILGDHEVYVEGTGLGVRTTKDECRFISIPAHGDFELSARIDCIDDIPILAQGGLMVRASEDQNSAEAFLAVGPSSGGGTFKMNYRWNAGQNATTISLTNPKFPAFPAYLKIQRSGAELKFSTSLDGQTFAEVKKLTISSVQGANVINLPDDVLIGLAATAFGASSTRVTFREVSGPPFQGGGQPPAKPTGLAATPGPGSIALDWNDNAEADLQGYDVYRDGAKVASLVKQSQYADAGLTSGQRYCYRVRAVNPGGESPDSDEACATPQPVGVKFRRGDTNDDGKVDLSDAIVTLSYLFQGGTTPTCFDAADADDSGVLDLTDGIYPLSWLFQGGPEPPPPGPKDCGPDTTPQKPGQKPFPACVSTKCP